MTLLSRYIFLTPSGAFSHRTTLSFVRVRCNMGKSKAGIKHKVIKAVKSCCSCKIEKAVSLFSSCKSDGLQTKCIDCVHVYKKRYNRTEEGFLNNMYRGMVRNDEAKGFIGRTMTREQLSILAARPCYYSGVETVKHPHSLNQFSPDRLDNSKAHTFTNTVACLLIFQGGYATMTLEKCDQVRSQDPDEKGDIHPNMFRPMRKSNRKLPSGVKTTSHESCRKCQKLCPISEYTKTRSHGCRKCRSKKMKAYYASPRGALTQILHHARGRTKKIARKECSLTLEDLIEKFVKQGGRCAYSNMKLTFKGNWKLSLERLDPKLGYTRKNTVLICQEFNATDRSTTDKDNVSGEIRGWSRALVNTLIRKI
jgi:hypothetical protein